MVRQREPSGGFLSWRHECPLPSQEIGQDNVALDSVLRVRENTREVGVAQGRAQLLQHQGLLQLSAGTPVLPAGAALLQPVWEVLDERTIAQPVENAEVVEAATGGTGQSQGSI